MSKMPMEVLTSQSRRYDILVILPLLFITIFCFGFVLMHPYYTPISDKQTQASITHVSKEANVNSSQVIDISDPLPHLSTTSTGKTTSPSTPSTANSSISTNTSTGSEKEYSNKSGNNSASDTTQNMDQQKINDLAQTMHNLKLNF